MVILVVPIIAVLLVWVTGFLYANDFQIAGLSIDDVSRDTERILVIFPHADDEAISTGGFISQLSEKGTEVYWVVLTKGEKGTANATYNEELKNIRVEEARNASEIYKVHELIQKEYPDNEIDKQKSELKNEIKQIMNNVKPNLILTYDLAGLYGHPDHVVVSEVATELVKDEYSDTKLWYVSFPEKILNMTPLPDHMAKDLNYKSKRAFPTRRMWVGFSGVVNKIKAVYAYKSQRQAFIDSFPVKLIPLWFYVSLTPFEYIHEVE